MNWAHYLLQVNIYLVVFYGFYKLLLDKETYFVLNRVYLVSAGLLSLAIPFLRFEWFTTQPVAQPVYAGVDQFSELVTQVTVITEDVPDQFNPASLLVVLYFSGMLFFLLKFGYQLYRVRRLILKNGKGAAFSFFNRQVVDGQLPGAETISKHEEIHIRQLHSADVLFFEILGILTWFNPVIYFYKSTIKNIHEYLADEEAAQFQGNKDQYAILLMSNAMGVPSSTLINSFFNQSLLKKRIYMLYKQRSRKVAMLKYGLFVPLFAITLVASSATIRNNKQIKELTSDIPLENSLEAVKEVVQQATALPAMVTDKKTAAKSADQSETSLAIAQDWTLFYNFVKQSVRYPSSARTANVQGTSLIKFSIKNGEVEDAGVVSKLGSGCDTEVMRTILAYRNFKTISDGKYLVPVSFSIEGGTAPAKSEPAARKPAGYTLLNTIVVKTYPAQDIPGRGIELSDVVIRPDESGKVYDFVSLDTQPNFPGGMDQFYNYVQKSIRYPLEARDTKLEGKVFLSFVVEVDGQLTNIKVERRLGGGTDEEAVRVLEESPRWIPGAQGGQKVRVKYNMPISFALTPPGSGYERSGRRPQRHPSFIHC